MTEVFARPLSRLHRGGYGLWEATVLVDGQAFTGGGLTRDDAIRRARQKASDAGHGEDRHKEAPGS